MRFKTVISLAAALMIVATAAGANHSFLTSFSLDDSSPSASSDWTVTADFGTSHPDSLTIHIEGMQLAHADGNDNVGGSGDEPIDGDTLDQVAITARWKALFCATSTITVDATWETDLSNPPAGISNPVARIQYTPPSDIVDVWITGAGSAHGNVSANHYDLFVTDFGDSTCSSGTVTWEFTMPGEVAGSSPARYVSENPSSTGTYDVEMTYIDTSSNSHSDSTTYDIN